VNCSFESVIDLNQWMSNVIDPLQGGRYPLSGSIELTSRCNLSCLHCFINQPPADRIAKSNELSTDEWKSTLDQMADAGCIFLLITGGEPMLRDDFKEILIHTRKRGFLVCLFTNATMLDSDTADLIEDLNLQMLEISLYGATKETYEQVTGQPGSFERCLRGIELALERNIKVRLKTILLTVNQHELEQMRILTEDFGLKFRYDSTLWPRLDGTRHNLQYQVPNQEMLALDHEDPPRQQAWLNTAESFKGQLIRAENVFTCGAGYRSFHIDYEGNMNPCMMVRKPSYSILDMGFNAAWREIGAIRELKRQLHTECETCPAAALCTQCPGWSLAFYDDYETPVPNVCELGKSRMNQFLEIALL